MKKRIVVVLLAIAIAVSGLIPFANFESNASSYSLTNHQQTESPWGYTYYDGYTFASSGCGIMSTVNAVHYATGNWINPLELANWAHSAGFYTGTDGTYRSMWSYLNSSGFASAYGFKVVTTAYSTVYDTAFRNHIANGGVAVVHVYGHYMAIVDYNSSTGQYLLWDNAAGPVCGYKRPTSTAGDWCTAAELEGGWNSTYLTIDWYCLISSTGSSSGGSTSSSYKVTTNVVSGGGKAGFNDDCSSTSVSVEPGKTVYFRVTPNTGYKATKVVVGGTSFTLKNNGEGSQVYTFTMPQGAVGIDVTFSKTSYTVKTNCTTGGKAGFNDDCSNTSASVTQGTKVYFRVTPDSGYRCSKILVGGTTWDLTNNGVGSQVYNFMMPYGNVVIDVTFEKTGSSTTTTNPSTTTKATATAKPSATATPAPADITVMRDQVIVADQVVRSEGIPENIDADFTQFIGEYCAFFGWIASTKEITSIGYTLDNGTKQYDSTFLLDAEQGVVDAAISIYGGTSFASRFYVKLPINDSKAHVIKLYAKFGTEEKVFWTINCKGGTTQEVDPGIGTSKPSSTNSPSATTKPVTSSVTFVSRDELIVNHERMYEAGGIPETVTIKVADFVGEKLEIFGWFASSAAISKFGYKLDNNPTIYDAEYKLDAEAEIKTIAAGQCGEGADAARYDILVPINDTNGHVIRVYATDATGEKLIWTVELEKGEGGNDKPVIVPDPTPVPDIDDPFIVDPDDRPQDKEEPVVTEAPIYTEEPSDNTIEPDVTNAPSEDATEAPADANPEEEYEYYYEYDYTNLILLLLGILAVIIAGSVALVIILLKKKKKKAENVDQQ